MASEDIKPHIVRKGGGWRENKTYFPEKMGIKAVHNHHARELISARETSYKHNNKYLSRLR